MRFLVLLIIISGLLSCATQQQGRSNTVDFNNNSRYLLQAVPESMRNTASLEQLRVLVGEEHHDLLLQTEIFAEQVKMVGFSLSGMVLFEMTWDPENGLSSIKKLPVLDLDVTTLFAYFQLARWPQHEVTQGLQGMTLIIDEKGRSFKQNGELVFSTTHVLQTVFFRHHRQQFQIEIKKIKQWDLNEQLN